MNDDDIQKAWQSQGGEPKLTLSADLLLHEVQRNKTSFDSMLFWRDVREIAIAILMTGLFLYWGLAEGEWWLLPVAGACLWVGGFMLVDRRRQRSREPLATDPLQTCVEASLRQVDHQIWLLKNVAWWYLLLPGIGIGIWVGYLAWLTRSGPAWLSLAIGGCIVLLGLLFWGVYRLNQYAVTKTLAPRRQELQNLLSNLVRPS